MEFPVFQFVPLVPCTVTEHHYKEPGSIPLTPALEIFVYIDKAPSQLPLPQAKQPYPLSLSS